MGATLNPSLYSTLFLSFFFIPLAVFSIVAVFARPLEDPTGSTERLDDYLISGRDMQQWDYINSSAAYMLQVSTTFYFVFWGYNYGLSNIWYLVSWALGILLFSRFAPLLLIIRSNFETLPSFLAGGRFGALRYTAAAITIASFLAIYYVESYFSVDFISTLANPSSNEANPSVWWIFFVVLTGLTVLYSLFGGMRRVILTDRWQLSFAYLCIAIIFSYLIPKSFSASPISAIYVSTLMLALFGALMWMNHGIRNRLIVKVSLLLSFAIIFFTVIFSFKAPVSFFDFEHVQIAGPFRQLSEPLGWFTLLGFTILNLLWQFCDNSNYQRIASLELPEDKDEAAKLLRRLISRLIIVSPLTWGLGIILGIAIRTAGITTSEVGKEYLGLLGSIKLAALSGDMGALAAVLALSAALTSIMMETVDGALIAFAQCLMRDVIQERQLHTSRLVALCAGAFFLVLFFAILHRIFATASILTVMAGAYSAMVVLAVPAILKMLGRKVDDRFVIAGVLFGFGLTWIATFGPFSTLPWNVKLVLPLYAGPIGTSLIILVGLLAKGEDYAVTSNSPQ
jgi:Na+/proline symporter